MTKALAVVVGAIVGLVPIVAGAVTMFDPLIKRRRSVLGTDDEGFLKVTSASSLDSTGAPRMFPVIADLQDAWNKFPNTEIGSVYLWKTSEGEIKAFTSRCPHLGCTVNYKAGEKLFGCPCHDSSFNLDGTRNNEIPPRGMDSLDVKEVDGEILVKFQKFRAGIHDRIPV
ncbi:MAG: Rieske (2Fe-2S) protein [Planctomycetaceae bacterium]